MTSYCMLLCICWIVRLQNPSQNQKFGNFQKLPGRIPHGSGKITTLAPKNKNHWSSPCCACSQFPGLKDHVPQSNNYVVYNDFFNVHQLAPMQRGRLPGMVRHCLNV